MAHKYFDAKTIGMKCLEDVNLLHEILVPLDGSEYSKSALETAENIAKMFDGKITLIHVYSLS